MEFYFFAVLGTGEDTEIFNLTRLSHTVSPPLSECFILKITEHFARIDKQGLSLSDLQELCQRHLAIRKPILQSRLLQTSKIQDI
jgi:hypothetical protein